MKQKSKQVSNSFYLSDKVVGHFTVTGCKRVDLVLIQWFLIYYVLMLTFIFSIKRGLYQQGLLQPHIHSEARVLSSQL